jgi:hypothetical protein
VVAVQCCWLMIWLALNEQAPVRPVDGLYWPLGMQVVAPLGKGAAFSVISENWRTA